MLRSPHRYWKGDGTGNDFVVVLDLDDQLTFSEREVAALCDRARGIGADGLLRVVRHQQAAGSGDRGADYFMDYRNADGSIAEMCGNGIRVFTQFLIEQGLLGFGQHHIATRAGLMSVLAEPAAEISVDMGVAQVLPHELAVSVGGQTFSPAVAVLMPNPHAVTLTAAPPADLSVSPQHHPEQVLAQGANYEFVTVHSRDHISMRVYERGVGETASCGTGACAAAVVAAQQWAGSHTWTVRVDVPGGRLQVHCDAHGHLHLQGPAQITESGIVEFAADGHVTIGERADVVRAVAPQVNDSFIPRAPEGAQ